jgi:hypothetical protein
MNKATRHNHNHLLSCCNQPYSLVKGYRIRNLGSNKWKAHFNLVSYKQYVITIFCLSYK